ncbi:hypothetical protein FS837_011989 [Tulasnella sp. UAMH 9824]|nr:hypothetical protein FS837_011989 [Tulasnella sp. UAMH 9824]
MTNGGGVTEAERCTKLSRQLGVNILPSQLVQAHTILRKLKHKYADKPVLILGGKLDKGREVAESYGFRKAYTTLDLLAWDKSIWPFHELTDIEKAATKKDDFSKIPFEAIIVIHDPRDWALDVQVSVDILRSRNKICREPYKPDAELGSDPEKNVELIFCNPDLLWKSDYPNVRFGQGAFKEALQTVLKATTGKEYPYTQYGKPYTPTYKFAADVLRARIEELEGPAPTSMPAIFMVGDNPASDIAGANGAAWKSVLVHTGVYDPTQGPPAHRPTVEAKDVEAAVHWAFKEVTQHPL